jgi:hypothetical protein
MASPQQTAPSVAEIENISKLQQPVIRNLQITQCYYELSKAFALRTGASANWCTFAVWASKQAGQTIRREDLLRILEARLKLEPEVQQALNLIATLAKKLGTRQNFEQIRSSAIGILLNKVVDRASQAVSRGNKKVFEEIARQFAHFIATCFTDITYSKSKIDDFCAQLITGDPPNGQAYLCTAFTRYYESFFMEDLKQKAELQFLANLEIGFHEQTRLQPEIEESLNAASIDPVQVKDHLLRLLFPDKDYVGQFWLFLQNFFQKTALLNKAIETFVFRAQVHLRKLLTFHMMTITVPPDRCLRLGQDLTSEFPVYLKELIHPDLLSLLKKIDPTQNSVVQSGATDWANLLERLHYIADLFRCYFDASELFDPPFTEGQTLVLKAGKLPDGRL